MPHGRGPRLVLSVLVLLVVACGSLLRPRGARDRAGPPSAASNVLRGDYAGSRACAPCHAEIYAQWSRSPMHRMTRVADTAEIRAPFDGAVFRFGTDAVRAFRVDDRRYVSLSVAGQPDALYRVTRVIGGRYREDFAALRVADTTRDAAAVGDPRAEMVMPVSWVFAQRAWRYKGYSVMVRERPGMRAGPDWRTSCVFCHNTVPYLDTALDELYGPGAPSYQGALQDRLLPPERAFRHEVTDAHALAGALADEIEFLRGRTVGDLPDEPRELLARAIRTTRDHFDARHLVEVGIGCETCHNGSRAHAEHPEVRPTFEPRSEAFRVRAPAGAPEANRAQWINRVCVRCHTVLFSRYPYTWEGGQRHGDATPGGSHINSGEARDFLLGGCASQMSCALCHDPHTEDTAADLHRLETPAGNATCTHCHTQFVDTAAVAAHTHHAPAGAGAVCINCHMPRKNMGLAYNLTRYHRIGSPNDPARVERDRPLECALCHTDRSVGSLVETMERWWGRRYDRAALQALYGNDLGVNPLRWSALHGLPHEVATSVAALGGAHAVEALPEMVEALANEYPLVRYFALHAIEATVPDPPRLDMNQDGAALVAQGRAWLQQRAHTPVSPP